MAQDSVSITDNRTGKKYEIPIVDGAAIRASDLREIRTSEDDFGLMSYDPAFMNTASCRSAMTFIDGDRGILEYRGYPIAQLAEHSPFLEVAYLVINGELPTQSQLKEFVHNITVHTIVHENIKKFIDAFHYDAHPMGSAHRAPAPDLHWRKGSRLRPVGSPLSGNRWRTRREPPHNFTPPVQR